MGRRSISFNEHLKRRLTGLHGPQFGYSDREVIETLVTLAESLSCTLKLGIDNFERSAAPSRNSGQSSQRDVR